MTDTHNVPPGPVADRYVDAECLHIKIDKKIYGNILKVTFTATEIEVLLADGSWVKSTDFQFATSRFA